MASERRPLPRHTATWNGALSYATTGPGRLSACLDYWSKAGTYAGRSTDDVAASMAAIFADDERIALGIVFGLRLITRRPDVEEIDDVQTGQGRRDEFFKALCWLADHRPRLLDANLHLVPVFGCWKDFLSAPLIGRLDRDRVYALVRDNLDDALLRKYLPQIRSTGCIRSERDLQRSDWAKGLCRFLGIRPQEYRRLKAAGTAHRFQQQMGQGEWDQIAFNEVPGRAMLHLISRRGRNELTPFERHGQTERLREWVLNEKAVKFTGYPYELTSAASRRRNPSPLQQAIYDRQFETILAPMRGHQLGNVLCALDTSGSMGATVAGKTTALDVCVSLGLVFSSLNVGLFQDAVVAFDSTSRLIRLKGTFCERLHQIETMETAWGSTNFQSVIDLLVQTRRQHPDTPVAEFPSTLLVVSDMQFNPVEGNTETNYERAMKQMRKVGLRDLRIIWWFVNGEAADFPARMDDRGVYLIGGFDPTNLKALLGLDRRTTTFDAAAEKHQTPLDGLLNFLAQPIFTLLTTDV